MKKYIIKISTLTLSSVAVLQAALQLPLQEDWQSRPKVKDLGLASNFRGQLRMQIFLGSTTQLEKYPIKISTLTMSTVTVLQVALQLPLQQDSQSKKSSNIWIGIQLHEAADTQYFGAREVMYLYTIQRNIQLQEGGILWSKRPCITQDVVCLQCRLYTH